MLADDTNLCIQKKHTFVSYGHDSLLVEVLVKSVQVTRILAHPNPAKTFIR